MTMAGVCGSGDEAAICDINDQYLFLRKPREIRTAEVVVVIVVVESSLGFATVGTTGIAVGGLGIVVSEAEMVVCESDIVGCGPICMKVETSIISTFDITSVSVIVVGGSGPVMYDSSVICNVDTHLSSSAGRSVSLIVPFSDLLVKVAKTVALLDVDVVNAVTVCPGRSVQRQS